MKFKIDGMKAVLMGAAVTLGLSMGLTALDAALLGAGVLPENMIVPACVITAASALVGGLTASGHAGSLKLPAALAAAGVYLLTVFILRGILFGDVSQRPWLMPLMAGLGALAGGVLSAGRKKRPAVGHRRR